MKNSHLVSEIVEVLREYQNRRDKDALVLFFKEMHSTYLNATLAEKKYIKNSFKAGVVTDDREPLEKMINSFFSNLFQEFNFDSLEFFLHDLPSKTSIASTEKEIYTEYVIDKKDINTIEKIDFKLLASPSYHASYEENEESLKKDLENDYDKLSGRYTPDHSLTVNEVQNGFYNHVSKNTEVNVGEIRKKHFIGCIDTKIDNSSKVLEVLANVKLTGKPSFFIISDGMHWSAATLLPDFNDPSKVSIVYSNSIPGNNVGKKFLEENVIKLIEKDKSLGFKLSDDKIIDVSVYQQVSQCCGLATAYNLSSMLKFYNKKREADDNEYDKNPRSFLKQHYKGEEIEFRPYGDTPPNNIPDIIAGFVGKGEPYQYVTKMGANAFGQSQEIEEKHVVKENDLKLHSINEKEQLQSFEKVWNLIENSINEGKIVAVDELSKLEKKQLKLILFDQKDNSVIDKIYNTLSKFLEWLGIIENKVDMQGQLNKLIDVVKTEKTEKKETSFVNRLQKNNLSISNSRYI